MAAELAGRTVVILGGDERAREIAGLARAAPRPAADCSRR